jgi:exo-beta-1,3-glucanase (GH17 family)
MKIKLVFACLLLVMIFAISCSQVSNRRTNLTASEILGNPEYLAFSYGGYRQNTREIVPTIEELKDDMKILSVMGVKLLRTYNTKQYAHAANLLEAIRQLRAEDASFEMYVMLGTWIECDKAWTSEPNHSAGNTENNTAEIDAAVQLANDYSDIVKIIAVGNEAMVQWAVSYFVYPSIILKWVNHLQELKKAGGIPADVWVTSSDNFASWGGGAENYQTDDLVALIKAVDFVSLHTYPFHDSHYNPAFWGVPEEEEVLSDLNKIDAAMRRAKDYAISQYQGAADYITSLGIDKPIHIGETGWATMANSSYGANGSQAADEYKEKRYYQHMREWTNQAGMSCFYFEAFDEKWKDQSNEMGSENHFGLIKPNGQAKYALWEMVDNGVFDGLTRNGVSITKTYGGNKNALMNEILIPPLTSEMGVLEISTVNEKRKVGQSVTEGTYVVVSETLLPDESNNMTYPSAALKLNAWEGTCNIEMSHEGIIEIVIGTGNWWGCALEINGGIGEDMSNFKSGKLNIDIKGSTNSTFHIGFQTGLFSEGSQVNNQVTFGPGSSYTLTNDWKSFTIPISNLDKGADLTNVMSLLYLRGEANFDGGSIEIKNLSYTQ